MRNSKPSTPRRLQIRKIFSGFLILFCFQAPFWPIGVASAAAPEVRDDSYSTDEDTPLTVAAPGVLANDSIPEGEDWTMWMAIGPVHGTLTLNLDGSFIYTPNSDYYGSDTFTYRVDSEFGLPMMARVTITINPVPDLVVTNTNDSGPGSLRFAIEEAQTHPGPDTVTFALSPGDTITLASTLVINDPDLTLSGPGADQLAVSGNGTVRVYNIQSGSQVSLQGLIIRDGYSDLAGGIYNDGALSLTDCVFNNNSCDWAGGGIYNHGNLTLTGCTVSGSTSEIGGGIYNMNTLQMSHSTVSGNAATTDGGGIYNGGTLSLTDCVFSNNSSDWGGGGIYNQADLTLSECVISDNTADRGGGIYNMNTLRINQSTVSGNAATWSGGGIENEGDLADLTLTTCFVNNNTAAWSGGGIESRGTLSLIGCTVSGNSTSQSNHHGGGISNRGDLTLTGCTVSGNTSEIGGGIYNFNTLHMSHSTVSGNAVTGFGGGIENEGALSLTCCTLSGNTASGSGGGIHHWNLPNKNLTVAHSTVTGNSASTGGGIYVSGSSGSTLLHTILAGNTASSGPDGYGNLTASYCLIGNQGGINLYGMNNLLNRDPRLGPLADNGGPTRTHILLSDSPAIDAGDPSLSPNDMPSTDQCGQPRVYNSRVDLGAFEIQNSPPTVGDDTYGTDEDTPLTVAAAQGVLANDSDPEGLNLTAALVAGPTHGALTFATEGSFTYTPAADYHGRDGFTYRANDGIMDSVIVSVTITVNPAPDLVVTHIGDSGLGSLRYAIEEAQIHPGADTVTFALDPSATIHLSSPLTIVDPDLTIAGPGADLLAVSGANAVQVFSISPGSQVSLQRLTIRDGNALLGGGIGNQGTLTLADCTVSGNAASTYGGGIYNLGILTLSGCTVNGNAASNYGGGIFNEDATLILTGCTVSGNTASSHGGGIFNWGISTLTVAYGTITANSALHGGGIFNFGSRLDISHTILANNTATEAGPDGHGAFSISYCLIGNPEMMSLVGTNNLLNRDPRLGPLADNGGPTLTHALLPDSPAIDAGDPAFTPPPATDQRGQFRVYDGDATPGAVIDIGAYEYQNTPPGAVDDAFHTHEDTLLTVATPGVLANDTDPEGLALTAILITGPVHGGLTFNSDGSFTYTPAADYHGRDGFTYQAHDGVHNSIIASVIITVNPINDAPSFVKGADVTVDEDAGFQSIPTWATTLSWGPNEADHVLTFHATNDNPGLFTVLPAISANGVLTFTPAPHAVGTATVTVILQDDGGTAHGGVDRGTAQIFTITLMPVNDPPSFTKGNDVSVNEDAGAQSLTGWAAGISTGPANEAHQSLYFTVSNNNNALFATQPALSSSGTLTFTPAPNTHGSAQVSVVLWDDGGTANGGVDSSSAQSFTLTVLPVNDPPTVAVNSGLTLPEGAAGVDLSPALRIEDPDQAAAEILINVATAPLHGWLALAGVPLLPASSFTQEDLDQNHVTYTHDGSETTGDAWVFTASDGTGGMIAETAFVFTVTPVNDAPLLSVLSPMALEEGGTTSVTFAELQAVDSEQGPAQLTYNLTVPPAHGILRQAGAMVSAFTQEDLNQNPIIYTHDGGEASADSCSFSVTDGAGGSVSGTLAWLIASINDPPVIVSTPPATVSEDSGYLYAITCSDPDSDQDPLDLFGIDIPAWLTLTRNGPGAYTLAGTPRNEQVGSHTLILRVSDGSLTTDQTYTLTVLNVNDPPVFTSTPVTQAQTKQPYTYTVTARDPDPGVTALQFSVAAKPAWLTLSDRGNGTAVLTGSPPESEGGSSPVVLWVSDGVLTTEQVFLLIVAPEAATPTPTVSATKTVTPEATAEEIGTPTRMPSATPTPVDTPTTTSTTSLTATPTATDSTSSTATPSAPQRSSDPKSL